MSFGIIGKKIGMTHVFTSNGNAIAVTVVDVADNQVVQVKSSSGKDGYDAVQLGFDSQKSTRVGKSLRGHFEKHNATPKKKLAEFRLPKESKIPEPGQLLNAEVFPSGSWVDVIGTTIGKGFQGVVKRYGFAGQPMSHGSMMHRRPGSIGCRLTPGLVWKNQKMPGHMGAAKRTIQNLKIIEANSENGILLIAGAIPGSKGNYVLIRPSVKNPAARIAKAEAAKTTVKSSAKKK